MSRHGVRHPKPVENLPEGAPAQGTGGASAAKGAAACQEAHQGEDAAQDETITARLDPEGHRYRLAAAHSRGFTAEARCGWQQSEAQHGSARGAGKNTGDAWGHILQCQMTTGDRR